jgi:hypothetical protein
LDLLWSRLILGADFEVHGLAFLDALAWGWGLREDDGGGPDWG